MFEQLKKSKRLLMQADLVPAQGDRFQPTGFADIGAATYHAPDGTPMLLVESAQSMANRLEQTIIGPEGDVIDEMQGISYVRAKLTGDTDTTTTSLIEAHRINSPFIISDEAFRKRFMEEAHYGKGRPINWQKVSGALFRFDVNSLLHGVFLANLEDGRVKVARALSAFIEASGVQEVVSGGVKNNPLDPSGKLRAKSYDKDVYGNVPYTRVEYTAREIRASFNLDLGLLRSYALGDDAMDLLVGLALFKVQTFLEDGTRLRTACDFRVVDALEVTEPAEFAVPAQGSLLEMVQTKIKACADQFASPSVTELGTEVVLKKENK